MVDKSEQAIVLQWVTVAVGVVPSPETNGRSKCVAICRRIKGPFNILI